MRKEVNIRGATARHSVPLSDLNQIEQYMLSEPAVYYVRNLYNDDYYGRSVELFCFKIIKTTEFYFLLENGTRMMKTLGGNHYASTPSGALRKSLRRANRYLDILIRRGESVSKFLKAANKRNNKDVRELRNFAVIAAQFRDVDDIPPNLLKDYDIEPDKLKGFLE